MILDNLRTLSNAWILKGFMKLLGNKLQVSISFNCELYVVFTLVP